MTGMLRNCFLILALFCLADAVISARAQQALAPAPQDPLMSLMLSQPKIDLVSPVEAVAAFDPPVVAPGQQTIYRVTLSGLEASTEWPAKLVAPPEPTCSPARTGKFSGLWVQGSSRSRPSIIASAPPPRGIYRA